MEPKEFAKAWIASWNTHNLEDILDHYSEDVEITTPMLRLAADIDSDTLKGKESVREYWSKALNKIPDLHFEFIDYAEGVDSIALYYKSVMNKLAIEVMFFNKEGKVYKVVAHYK
jgi:ketosteroid isomerase-like protein